MENYMSFRGWQKVIINIPKVLKDNLNNSIQKKCLNGYPLIYT